MSDFNIVYNTEVHLKYDIKNYVTKKYLTKYEKTKILGLRAQQISTGSPVFTKVPEGMISPLDIAEKELKERKIPFILKRSVGNDKYEYWKLEDLVY